MTKSNVRQLFSPIINRWVKIDTETGNIISHKKTAGEYKKCLKLLPEVTQPRITNARHPRTNG